MSTRRARIKAVAALPPRRKNQDSVGAKNKHNEDFEKGLPISSISKTSMPGPSPANVVSPKAVEKVISTPRLDKVPVITSTPGIRNVFASSQVESSPNRRKTASPLVLPSTSSSESVAKLTTSHLSKAQDNNDKNVASNASQRVDISTPDINKKSYVPDESITEESETVMDGIVPLQRAKNAPIPIDLLKNDIISECTEVSFDPIVPLPSPSKVRPKLRPVPRLAPHRSNSIQGSASESEDESRRVLLSGNAPTTAPPRQRHDSQTSLCILQSVPNRDSKRMRNDSIGSSISQVATQPPPATSPFKEKHFSNKTRQEMGRTSLCRRRVAKGDTLTMYDLIFYNPTTNPIVPDEDEMNAREANAKTEAERNAKAHESEEVADDPPPNDAAPVPQIKLGPNGEIILDEQSLVIKQSDANRKVSSVVRERLWDEKYTRSARTAEWSAAETVRFYRALAAVGTDFTLMARLFPDRNRRDLYLKFKKEERLNGAQIDKALLTTTAWDPADLEADFRLERVKAARKVDAERESLLSKKEEERVRLRAANKRRKRSKAAKALEISAVYGAHQEELTADEFMQRNLESRAKAKQKKATQLPKPPTGRAAKFLPEPKISAPPTQQRPNNDKDLATVSRIDPSTNTPQQVSSNEVVGVPSNIDTESLVVLRVNEPAAPTETMLQTYIAHGAGELTPVSLAPTSLNSMVGYMKKGTPKSTISTASSPQLTSPSSGFSQDSSSCTPGVIQLTSSPAKRTRHSSYDITPL